MNTRAFERRVIDCAASLGLFDRRDRVLLALSGGADSTALLYILHRCRQLGRLPQAPLCIHLNHQLRQQDSDLDEAFARACANSLGLEFQSQSIDVKAYARQHRLSVETAARELRLRCLVNLSKAGNCTTVATGHHRDDNAETVLQRLSRGTGFRGLAGIWPKRTIMGLNFISPLLCVGREDIRTYLRARELAWREDASNHNCSFRRNFIRHKLLPTLQQSCVASLPTLLDRLSIEARKLQEQVNARADMICAQLAHVADDRTLLPKKRLLSEPEIIQIELMRRILVDLGCGERNLSAGHYQRVIQLANAGRSNRIQLPEGFAVRSQSDILTFEREPNQPPPGPHRIPPTELNVPGFTAFGPYAVEAHWVDAAGMRGLAFERQGHSYTEHLDWDKLDSPISIRFRRAGDRFCPLGKRTPQRVSKFLINAKIPAIRRDQIPILTDARKLIWVCPVRICDEAKVTAETTRILRIQVRFRAEGQDSA